MLLYLFPSTTEHFGLVVHREHSGGSWEPEYYADVQSRRISNAKTDVEERRRPEYKHQSALQRWAYNFSTSVTKYKTKDCNLVCLIERTELLALIIRNDALQAMKVILKFPLVDRPFNFTN